MSWENYARTRRNEREMQFLRLEGAIVRRHETGKLEETLTVCRCCQRASDEILNEEMNKWVDPPVYCDQCGNELEEME